MLRFLVLFLLASTAFANTNSNFDADYERSMKVINQSKATRAELTTAKREVASTDSNIVEEAGTLEEFMETAEHDLD